MLQILHPMGTNIKKPTRYLMLKMWQSVTSQDFIQLKTLWHLIAARRTFWMTIKGIRKITSRIFSRDRQEPALVWENHWMVLKLGSTVFSPIKIIKMFKIMLFRFSTSFNNNKDIIWIIRTLTWGLTAAIETRASFLPNNKEVRLHQTREVKFSNLIQLTNSNKSHFPPLLKAIKALIQ